MKKKIKCLKCGLYFREREGETLFCMHCRMIIDILRSQLDFFNTSLNRKVKISLERLVIERVKRANQT